MILNIGKRVRSVAARIEALEKGEIFSNEWELDMIAIFPGDEITVQISEWNGVEMSLAEDIRKYGVGHHFFRETFKTQEEAEDYINEYIEKYEKRSGKPINPDDVSLLNAVWDDNPLLKERNRKD